MRARRDTSLIEALLGFSSASARAERRGAEGEAAVAKTLRRLFAEVANDLILPDGRGGLTQVDHLVLTPAGLLVIETKNYRGMILGSAYERTWTQVVGPRRNQFQNPLRQNHAHIEAVKALAPGVPVIGRALGRLVFARRSGVAGGSSTGSSRRSPIAAADHRQRSGSTCANTGPYQTHRAITVTDTAAHVFAVQTGTGGAAADCIRACANCLDGE